MTLESDILHSGIDHTYEATQRSSLFQGHFISYAFFVDLQVDPFTTLRKISPHITFLHLKSLFFLLTADLTTLERPKLPRVATQPPRKLPSAQNNPEFDPLSLKGV
jgi:hypothetical protein